MNRRYIDFVPVDKVITPRNKVSGARVVPVAEAAEDNSLPVRKGAPKRVASKKITRKEYDNISIEEISKKEYDDIPVEEIFEEKPKPAGVSTGLSEPKYGIIEDYHPKFVRAEVKKRPLGVRGTSAVSVDEKVNVSKVRVNGPAKSPRPANTFSPAPVKANFINTNKIEKRPLSPRGASSKPSTLMAAAEKVLEDIPEMKGKKESKKKKKVKAKEPVRIIANSEKDSKAGMIVAVILTIILGAAAGTVAFLLLPK